MTHPARRQFDWKQIRSRLERAIDADRGRDQQSLLLERARRYAQAERVAESAPASEYLCFGLGGERYALETRYVVEVASREITRVPGAPERLLGLANFRGDILPVFDLARALGRSSQVEAGQGRLIVLGLLQPELGLVAGSVEGVERLFSRDILLEPEQLRQTFGVLGVTADALVVLDGRALLDSPVFLLPTDGEAAVPQEVSP